MHFNHLFFARAFLAYPHSSLALVLLLAWVAVDTAALGALLRLQDNVLADAAKEVVDDVSQLGWDKVR